MESGNKIRIAKEYIFVLNVVGTLRTEVVTRMNISLIAIAVLEWEVKMSKNKYGGVCNVTNPDKRVYALWYQMLRRCYDKEQHQRIRGKSYADCVVCDRWLNYSNFARDITLLFGYEDWLNKTGYCLDKDTIHPNNKVYSRESCCFIPYTENIRDVHNRKPQNIKKLHELNKVKYMLMKDDEVLLFESEKDACEYMGVVQCSISSCYRRGRKCKGYRIAKMDGERK